MGGQYREVVVSTRLRRLDGGRHRGRGRLKPNTQKDHFIVPVFGSDFEGIKGRIYHFYFGAVSLCHLKRSSAAGNAYHIPESGYDNPFRSRQLNRPIDLLHGRYADGAAGA